MIRASRVSVLHGAFVLFALVLAARSAKVQLLETAQWRAKARRQQVAASSVPAPRGRILDVTGALLVESRELVTLSVAPRETAGDRRRVAAGSTRIRALGRALARLGVAHEWVSRATDTSRAWVSVPGRFLASDVATISAIRGVHAERVLERVAPPSDGLRRLVGRADGAGEPVDGLEKTLDPLLRGEMGRAAVFRDAKGVRFYSPALEGSEPKPGRTVVLTINLVLQEIAERTLSDAVRQVGASGGDIIMLDPASGEVRAMASRRADPRSTAATALTEPYEPGSTLKPFVAARLLELKRARTDEVVNTFNGRWEVNGRRIVDDHPAASFSLADVIRYSSNIGIIQFAQRFSAREQYELLRDLGFGVPSGLPYPAEESGWLPSPHRWDSQTPASLAMGYALNVTPVQLAVAYGAIANGGELLEPALVKEIRNADGSVEYLRARRVVRRVMSEETASTLRGLLRGVVEGGTGSAAQLSTFDIGGKTGTAKRTEHGRYVAGRYTASFVALFPAEHPQLVVLVKLDDPQKSIYGGKAAAPVSKTLLLAALAARESSLDRRSLAAAPTRSVRTRATLPESATSADSLRGRSQSGSVPFVFQVGEPRTLLPTVVTAHAVPNVLGLPLRSAVYLLHRAGFRVTFGGEPVHPPLSSSSGTGMAAGTSPGAGAAAPAGSTVHLSRLR